MSEKPLGLAKELRDWVERCEEMMRVADHFRTAYRDAARTICQDWIKAADFKPRPGDLVALATYTDTTFGWWNKEADMWWDFINHEAMPDVIYWAELTLPRHPKWRELNHYDFFEDTAPKSTKH